MSWTIVVAFVGRFVTWSTRVASTALESLPGGPALWRQGTGVDANPVVDAFDAGSTERKPRCEIPGKFTFHRTADRGRAAVDDHGEVVRVQLGVVIEARQDLRLATRIHDLLILRLGGQIGGNT